MQTTHNSYRTVIHADHLLRFIDFFSGLQDTLWYNVDCGVINREYILSIVQTVIVSAVPVVDNLLMQQMINIFSNFETAAQKMKESRSAKKRINAMKFLWPVKTYG